MKPIKFSTMLVIALLLGSAVGLNACTFSLAEEITPPPGSQQMPSSNVPPTTIATGPLYPLVAPNPQDGQAVYVEKCAPCHGTSGQGDGPQSAQLPNPATPIGSPNVARPSVPAEWYRIVSQGNLDRFMPPFQSLSDRQRWDVIAYVYSMSASEESVERGAGFFEENCAVCHGSSGRGDGTQAGSLSTKLPDFTSQAYMAQKSTSDFYTAISSGVGGEMHSFTDFAEEERWDVANYLRTLSFASTGQVAAAQTPAVPASPVETDISAAPEADSGGSGLITGQIINASGSQPPAGLVVTLHGFDGMQVVITDTVKTAADGTFAFENVEMPSGRVFLATTEYGEATYASTITTLGEGETTLSLNITTYDTTTDLTSMSTDRLHVFFDFSKPDIVQVIELYIMSNLGDKTVVPAEKGAPVVSFTLPEGAANLQFQDGELGNRYRVVPGGFADTLAVRPSLGEYQVLFAYEMDYSRKLELRRTLNLPVQAVVIMQPEDGVKIKSDQLQDGGPRQIQGATYRIFSGGPFNAGDVLNLSLTGNPSGALSSLSTSTSNQSLIIGLGAFGVVLIAAGIWLFRRNQTTVDEEDEEEEIEESEEEDLEQDPESLMDAIIALDDLYQAGELPEPAYRQRREELKTQLKRLEGKA